MLSTALERAIDRAFHSAQSAHHEFLVLEHLLLALLDDQSVIDAIHALGGSLIQLREDINQHLETYCPKFSTDNENQNTQPTMAFHRMIQRMVLHARNAEKKEVTCLNALIAIASEHDSHAAYFLNKQEITRSDLIHYESHNNFTTKQDEVTTENISNTTATQLRQSPLELFTVNLNARAKHGDIDPLIGREKELERTMQTLCRRRKNNPLLVGEAGVGKTAIVEGLAAAIVAGNVPSVLKDAVIYSLDIGGLLAGTKFRGDFEHRLKTLIKTLTQLPHAILFIDEIHTIIGAGSTSNSSTDASNLIKPALANSTLCCIGATTTQEYRQIFEKDSALARRFQKIDVAEPNLTDTMNIIKKLRERYECFHQIRYLDEAIEAAVTLSDRYINDRHLPDKAIDLIDEAGARARIINNAESKAPISALMIEQLIASVAKIPEKRVSQDDKKILKNLARDLKSIIFGQDAAINQVVDAIKLSRAGLRTPNKPIANFLFTGPTGVGKTELCRQLAHVLGIALLRFDMSEYMESHSISRLVGAPPGYVGYEQAGLLADKILKNPHSVLLLDEIEKAHPDIMNILLQIMDNGIFTDSNGREVNCRNLIIVMTSNVGARELEKNRIGFENGDSTGIASDDAVKRQFSPEFRNRLDAIISFSPLSPSNIMHVVDKFIIELEQQLDDKKITINVSLEAKQWLAQRGYDKKMGARPMARIIEKHIKIPIAEHLLFGEFGNDGGHISVSLKDNKLSLSAEKNTVPIAHTATT